MSKFDPYDHLNIAPNPDGSITRLLKIPKMPTNCGDESAESEDVICKDVVLSAEKKTKVRIFRPSKTPSKESTAGAIAKLPIFFFYHGGLFIMYDVADEIQHMHCVQFTTELPAIVIALDYRLAPENRLPANYDDAVDALLWLKHQALDPTGEPWLREYADFSKCYLYGGNCGGNMVFHTALRALELELEPVNIAGFVMNQPMFGGKRRTRSEIKFATDQVVPLPALDLAWELALPVGADRDHVYCNPVVDGPQRRKIPLLGRFLVIGFVGDPMFDRQQEFVKMLVLCGVRVMAKLDEIGFHGIDLVDPRRARIIMSLIKDFVRR